ncbi:uncharacterized protein BP5553_03856 [Venustampulla echinocandica]|uniref:Chromosome condensation protein (CrcB) n=1 Tax=Venustampulla echinocandica TaxID=2656787 RepID=A0A370TVG2_9HELO|nr:uncharacterized protein BP5553_03856 [Venustampulla echinocandica]RDL39516.1 hypothetical protein BP5553_03856 [Venustampulla echinocandica]
MAEDEPSPTQRASQDAGYDAPENYENLNELAASPDRIFPGERIPQGEARRESLVRSISEASQASPRRARNVRRQSREGDNYMLADNYANLDELAASPPIENPDENSIYFHRSLEDTRDQERRYKKDQEAERRASISRGQEPKQDEDEKRKDARKVSKFATKLYTVSYLILFSFLGTLARLGLQAITSYPGSPIIFSILWANFAGSLVMGFLSEDRMLFREEWGDPDYDRQIQNAMKRDQDEEIGSASGPGIDVKAAKKMHAATKKTIPLYIGLATGFCGCFTSFSTFIRDAFLAMSNELLTPGSTVAAQRNGGYSFMALLAVIIATLTMCISALHIGAHLAIVSEPFIPTLPFTFCRKVLDRIGVVLAWGCWLGAVLLAIFPPHDIWRGEAVFALVFAPLGCLGRFYASTYLNGKISSFPLGTFLVNTLGTIILGMAYDLQRVPLGAVVGCQVLQGIEDGFCGCLTTVSTWVAELSSLRRANAYRYGGASIIVALCFLIVIMGSMQWTVGFSTLRCTT